MGDGKFGRRWEEFSGRRGLLGEDGQVTERALAGRWESRKNDVGEVTGR